MTSKRIDGPTLHGGMYEVATFVKLATLDEVDEAQADGIVIAEYDGDGRWLYETVAEWNPLAASL